MSSAGRSTVRAGEGEDGSPPAGSTAGRSCVAWSAPWCRSCTASEYAFFSFRDSLTTWLVTASCHQGGALGAVRRGKREEMRTLYLFVLPVLVAAGPEGQENGGQQEGHPLLTLHEKESFFFFFLVPWKKGKWSLWAFLVAGYNEAHSQKVLLFISDVKPRFGRGFCFRGWF
jgi:hypothetical protein